MSQRIKVYVANDEIFELHQYETDEIDETSVEEARVDAWRESMADNYPEYDPRVVPCVVLAVIDGGLSER